MPEIERPESEAVSGPTERAAPERFQQTVSGAVAHWREMVALVTAAHALGLPEWRIIFRHMVPNAMAPVFVSASIDVAQAILTESALSFLGFGVRPPFATWGNILADGRSYILDAPWLFAIPGTAILVVVLAFNLVGEGLRDAMNPRLRKRAS